MRNQTDDSELELKMWFYPVLTWAVIAFITFTVVFMAFRDGFKLLLWLTLALTAAIVAIGVLRQRLAARTTADT